MLLVHSLDLIMSCLKTFIYVHTGISLDILKILLWWLRWGVWHYVPDVFWCCWLGGRKGIRPVKNSGGVLAWLAVCSEVQICIWSNWCHFHSLSIASVKSRLVLVLAHPGNPGRSPESRKMNVCLCLVTVVGWHLSCVLPTDVCYILYRQLCTVECLWQTSRKLSQLTLSVFWVQMVLSVVCMVMMYF